MLVSNIGYCPQFDSIIPELTGRELLNLMCRVRGAIACGYRGVLHLDLLPQSHLFILIFFPKISVSFFPHSSAMIIPSSLQPLILDLIKLLGLIGNVSF